MTAGLTTVPEGLGPDRFVVGGLGWQPWIEPLAQEELTERHIDALIEPERAANPYFRLLARDPEVLKARTLTDLDIFYNADDGLPRAERELAAATTSRLNGCVFCASVHTAFALREDPSREREITALVDDGVTADLGDERWNAIVAAVAALSATPVAFDASHVARLRAAGLDDTSIIDLINGGAFFSWANRLMLTLGEPEDAAKRRAAKREQV
ncbi:MAG: alkylhydroperoxidase domain protein [Arachnia sp.]